MFRLTIKLAMVLVLFGVSGVFVYAQEPPMIYVVTSQQTINARSCPQLTCAVVQTFAPGEEFTVTEITQGDTVNGSDEWLHVDMDGSDAYVHSSLATLSTESSAEEVDITVIDPFAAKAYFNRANAHIAQGNLEPAIAYYEEAIRFNPDHTDAYFNRGIAHYLRGDYVQAVADFTEVIRLDPENADAYFDRSCLYHLQDKDDLWEADFDEYVRLVGESGGVVEIEFPCTGRMERRIEWIEGELLDCSNTAATGIPQAECEALDSTVLGPGAEVYYGQGTEHLEQGEYALAIADFNEALGLNPDHANAHYNRGTAYYYQGNYTLAIADCAEYIRLVPGDPQIYNVRGAIYLDQGDFARAIADFDEAIRLDPEYATVYRNRGYVNYLQGKYDLALADLNEYVRLRGEDVDPVIIELIAEIEADLVQ